MSRAIDMTPKQFDRPPYRCAWCNARRYKWAFLCTKHWMSLSIEERLTLLRVDRTIAVTFLLGERSAAAARRAPAAGEAVA